MNLKIYVSGSVVFIITLYSMSLIRKFMRRNNTQKTLTDTDTEPGPSESETAGVEKEKETEEPEEEELKSETDSTVDESAYDEESEKKKGYTINADYRRKRRKLNAVLRKHGIRESHLERKQKEILQMETEIQELTRMLRINQIQEEALDHEAKTKKTEIASLCHEISVDIDMHNECKKKEPLFFKKYSNLKTAAEAKRLISNIGQRQRALKNLELLTYQKYLNITHQLKLKDRLLSRGRPPVAPKPDFNKVFNAIKDKIVYTSNTNTPQDADAGATSPDGPSPFPTPFFNNFDSPVFDTTV